MRKLLSLFSLLIVLSACSEKLEVKAARVAKGSVESIVTSVNSGTVRAEQQAELAFGAVGRVEALHFRLGDTVNKDQIISELENADLKSSVAYLERELNRRRELAKRKILSATDFEEISRQYDIASSALEKTLIRAPFTGVITELNIEVGQLSQITAVIPKPLVRIIDMMPRYVRAEIDELDLEKIRVDSPARIRVLAKRREPFPATVRKVVPFVSTIREQDRTAEIELTVQSPDSLLPVGASADVEIILEQKNDVLTVPSRTILGRQSDRYVFRFLDGLAKKTSVTVGVSNYDRAEILGGLTEGEIVLFPNDLVELADGTAVHAKLLE